MENVLNTGVYISLQKRIIFFHIPKTAGLAITNAFESCIARDHELNAWANLYYDVTKDPEGLNTRTGLKHLPYHVTQPSLKLFLNYIGQRVDNFFEFVVVRHPYERLLSLVKYSEILNKFNNSAVMSINSVLDAVEKDSNRFYQSQMKWIDNPITKKLNVYKYEELLTTGWQDIKTKLNLDLPNLQKINVSPLADLNLTKEQKMRCYQLFKREFMELGYEP